jgi:hypothetical protein
MTRIRQSRTTALDATCAEAVDLAFAAAEDVAGIGQVGAHLGMTADGERTVTHYFAARERGYVGWRWAVTVARASRSKIVTVDETVLVPGDGALLAPRWLPWAERLQPGDIGIGDLLPTAADDIRLEPGYTGAADVEPKPLRDDAPIPAGDATPEEPERDSLPAFVFELGLGRKRVLSMTGREAAAERWGETFGSAAPMAQAAPANCSTCGFLTGLTGLLSQSFGVCANEYSPADGHVVALDFGCGGHSEAAVVPEATELGEPIVDEFAVDKLQLHPTGSVSAAATPDGDEDEDDITPLDEENELGHS